MSEANGMQAGGGEAVPGGGPARELTGKLARYPGPAHRRAYLAALVAAGERFREAGNSRGAEYCFAKVAEALPDSGAAGSADKDAGESPAAGGTAPISPAETIRRQWLLERIRTAEGVLARHGDRLSDLENRAYGDKLDKLKQTGMAAAAPSQAAKADALLLELRRRLYGRILKSQKLSLRRRRSAPSLGRIAGPGLRSEKVRVDTVPQPVIGPYNDRYNMEDLLGLIAEADAAWVEEFLDLYRGLSGLQGLASAIAAAKK